MIDKRDGWYRFCRPYLEQLNPRDDLDLDPYVREMVTRAKGFNADTLVMMADDGGYPLYPSAIAPINSHIHGQDLLGMIEKECRKKGLRFGLGFLGVHCNSYAAATHPDWAMLDENGKVYPFYRWHLVCPNSPYGKHYVDLIGEALARYPVDYLYTEGNYFRPQGCRCASCGRKFRKAFGKEIGKATTKELHAFLNDSIEALQASIKDTADRVSPETVVVGASYHDWLKFIDPARLAAHTDMVAKENQWGTEGPDSLHMAGLGMLRLKALTGRPTLGTWWASHNVDLNYHQRSPAHAKLTFMQTLAYGAAIQPHIQTLFDFERSLMPTLAGLFSCVERARDYILDARLLPYVAVVNGPNALGYCNALQEHHLPFDLVVPDKIDEKSLAGHKVVIVDNAAVLGREAVESIAAYVRNGGGLVCAGRVGRNLAKLAGMELGAERDSGVKLPGLDKHPLYYRFEEKSSGWSALRGRLLAFRVPCFSVKPRKDCRVEARVIGLDKSRMHKDHMGIKPYPGSPLGPMVVTREVGRGRVLYFAAELAGMAMPGNVLDADVIPVLAEAALWAAGGKPPLTTSAPPTVELVTYAKKGRLAIFVLNQTVNVMDTMSVVRYVVPLQDVEIRVKIDAPVRKVTAVTGCRIHRAVRGGWLTIRIPKLAEYEVLLVDL